MSIPAPSSSSSPSLSDPSSDANASQLTWSEHAYFLIQQLEDARSCAVGSPDPIHLLRAMVHYNEFSDGVRSYYEWMRNALQGAEDVDDKAEHLARELRDGLFRAFRGTKTPVVSTQASLCDPDYASPHYRQASFRTEVMKRDNFRYLNHCQAIRGQTLEEGFRETSLFACHLIPFSAGNQDTSMFWNFVSMFIGPASASDINADMVDNASNGILLDGTSHVDFDRLGLAFDHIENDVYKVVRFRLKADQDASPDTLQTFASTDTVQYVARDGIELPDRRLMALRYTICCIANASAQSGILDEEFQEMQEIDAIPSDGALMERVLHWHLGHLGSADISVH